MFFHSPQGEEEESELYDDDFDDKEEDEDNGMFESVSEMIVKYYEMAELEVCMHACHLPCC